MLVDWTDVDPTMERRPSSEAAALRVLSVVSAVLLGAGVVAALTVGSSSSTPKPSALGQQLSAAANKTLDAKTAHYSINVNVSFSLDGTAHTVTEVGQGLIDFANQAEQLTLKTGALTEQTLAVNGVAYIQLPANVRATLHLTTPWASITVPKSSSTSAAAATGGADPAGTLRALIAASNGADTGARQIGSATIGGVHTTEYALQVNAAAASKNAQASAQQLLPGLTGVSLSKVALTVWIDDAGRVRQQSNTSTVTVPVQGQTIVEHVSLTLDFSDFGVPVNIQAPPADQVTRVSNLGRLFQGATTPSPSV